MGNIVNLFAWSKDDGTIDGDPEAADSKDLPFKPHLMTDVEQIKRFLFAGNATVTIKSKKTGARYTFRVREAIGTMNNGEVGPCSHFVALMNGPDNERDFQYFGNIYRRDRAYRLGRKSKIQPDAPSVTAFEWFYNMLTQANALSPQLEVWHEGRCGRCGRKLTVPESIASGIGPYCSGKLG